MAWMRGLMAAAALILAAPLPTWAQPAGLALVVGNASYTAVPTIPPLPGCAGGTRELSASLQALGFTVTERQNTGRGELDAAIAGFARALRDAPGTTAVAYICGHMATQGTRLFLLPVSASLQRDTDVLTQGVLARLVLDAMGRARVRAGLIVLDGGTLAQAEAMAALDMPTENIGLAAAQGAPGPLADALAEELKGPRVVLGDVLAGLRRRMPEGALATLKAPAQVVELTRPQAPPPSAPAAAAVQPIPVSPAPVTAPSAAPASSAPVPTGVAPAAPAVIPQEAPSLLLEERALTWADRRRVQQALAQMGYYVGAADGAFGPNTRAAIRRYQFELGAELTGTLTPAQAGRLLGLR